MEPDEAFSRRIALDFDADQGADPGDRDGEGGEAFDDGTSAEEVFGSPGNTASSAHRFACDGVESEEVRSEVQIDVLNSTTATREIKGA